MLLPLSLEPTLTLAVTDYPRPRTRVSRDDFQRRSGCAADLEVAIEQARLVVYAGRLLFIGDIRALVDASNMQHFTFSYLVRIENNDAKRYVGCRAMSWSSCYPLRSPTLRFTALSISRAAPELA